MGEMFWYAERAGADTSIHRAVTRVGGQNEELVLLYDLRLRAQDCPGEAVKYEFQGQVHDVPHMGADLVLGKKGPCLARKALHFRTIPTVEKTPQW